MSRTHSNESPTVSPQTRNRKAAWTLIILAPVVAELLYGSTPPHLAFLLLLWLPIYGAGVLLIRELVWRMRRGWPSIVLLGVAYELVEDGIGLQALTSPHLYHAAEWGPRVLGLNTDYWEANLLYHMVFSVVIPILLVELLFPKHKRMPYLGKGGLIATAIVAVIGVGLLRISVPPSQDPGYIAPVAFTISCLVVVGLIATVALKVLPVRQSTSFNGSGVPSISALRIIGGIAALLMLAPFYAVSGHRELFFAHGNGALLPMAVAAIVAVIGYTVIHRWSQSRSWTGRHALALASGALVAHTVFGLVTTVHSLFDRIGLACLLVIMLVLLRTLDKRVQQNSAGTGI